MVGRRHLNIADLRRLVTQRELELGQKMRCELRRLSVSYSILRELLGQKWIDEHFNPTTSDTFLSAVPNDPHAKLFAQWRIENIAEALFNLQNIKGFQDVLRRLSKSKPDAISAEMNAARFFLSKNFEFEFRAPGRKKTSDALLLFGSQLISCEIKSKDPKTALGKQTVKDSLNAARKQLPQSALNLVSLHLPYQWTLQSHWLSEVELGIAEFFSGSGRISAVILHWDWVATDPAGGGAWADQYKIFPNQRSNTSTSASITALDALGPIQPQGWVSLQSAVCDGLDSLGSEIFALANRSNSFMRGGGQDLSTLGPDTFMLSRGEVGDLQAVNPQDRETLIEFNCDQVEVYPEYAESGEITLNHPPLPIVKFHKLRGQNICRILSVGPELTSDLPLDGAGSLSPEALHSINPNPGPGGINPSDVRISFIQSVFSALRDERYLVGDQSKIRSIRCFFYKTQTEIALLTLEYINFEAIV